MASDELPRPEPRGTLVPPDRHPPTALGVDTPEPPRPPRQHWQRRMESTINMGPDLKAAMNKVLDVVDWVAETIAVDLGIRPAASRPPSSEPPAS